jgi:phosphate transport system permease protein
MTAAPPPPAGPDPLGDIEQLRSNIARRKRTDRAFFALGLSIIVLSLGILALLFANLVREGMPALTQTFYTKADQSGFGRNDLGGTARRDGAAWKLQLPPAKLEDLEETPAVLAMVDKPVGVVGRMRGGAAPQIAAKKLVDPASGETADFIGTLRRTELKPEKPGDPVRAAYSLVVDPLTVDVSAVPAEQMKNVTDGANVAFKTEGRVKNGTVTAVEVSPLETRNFFTSFPSRDPKEAGILSAWIGTLLVMLVTMVAAVPLGVAAGVYLEEYAAKNRFTAILEVNIANLAGVPSIIWGLMALGLFVYILHLGRSIQTAGLTLGLLVLPIVIIATREAIRAIPNTIREASIALGASKWQTVRHHILPYSMPGILTGSIIALSRAIGETAPLVTIGALTFIAFLPPSPIPPVANVTTPAGVTEMQFTGDDWLWSEFTVMPIQLFQWVSRPQVEFHNNAAAAGVVLLVMTLSLNAMAILLRYRLRRNLKW